MKFLMSKTAIASYALVAGLAGSASAEQVRVDYDRQADFARCATYAWSKGQPAENPFVDKRIVEAVDAALAARGWRKVEENPGCYVAYQASVKEEKSLQVWESGWRFRGGLSSVDVKTVLNGMLVVDIADPSSRQLIFRGVATDTISDKPEKNQKKLAKVTEKMFKELPAAGK